jgi:hypothetical protein
VPQARLRHKVARTNGGAGSPVVVYFETRSQLLFAEKHLQGEARRTFRRRLLQPLCSPVVHPPHRYDLLRLRRRLAWLRSPHGRAFVRALADFSCRRFGDCPRSVRRLAARAAAAGGGAVARRVTR